MPGHRVRCSATFAALLLVIGACADAGATSAVIPTELLAQARARGVVRTIIELRMPAGAGEVAIEVMKRRVLARIAGTHHQVVRDLPGLPMLVIDASEATLQELARSADVVRVNGEAIDRPQR